MLRQVRAKGKSKERLVLNSTPRLLTDDEEPTEQPSSIRQCSRLLHAEIF